jgi:hypothetical protein
VSENLPDPDVIARDMPTICAPRWRSSKSSRAT